MNSTRRAVEQLRAETKELLVDNGMEPPEAERVAARSVERGINVLIEQRRQKRSR